MRKLDEIVREYIIEKGGETEHGFPRYLQLAINGLRELNLDVSGVTKTVALEIDNDTLTAQLPDDYIKYVKIGVCEPDGLIHTMGYNPAICLPRGADECGNPKIDLQSTQGVGYVGANAFTSGISQHFRNGEIIGRFYGIGGGQNAIGQYRIDKENNQIQFGSVPNLTAAVLEYIGDISTVGGEHMVHEYVVEALKAYMYWADIRRKRSVGLGEKQMARAEFYNEQRKSTERYNSFTFEEALQALRRSFKLAPKI